MRRQYRGWGPPHRLIHAARYLAPDAVARCRCTAHFSCGQRRLSLGHHLASGSVGEGIQRGLVGARPHNAAVGRDAQRRRGHAEALPRKRLGVVLRDVDPAPPDSELDTPRDSERLLLQRPLLLPTRWRMGFASVVVAAADTPPAGTAGTSAESAVRTLCRRNSPSHKHASSRTWERSTASLALARSRKPLRRTVKSTSVPASDTGKAQPSRGKAMQCLCRHCRCFRPPLPPLPPPQTPRRHRRPAASWRGGGGSGSGAVGAADVRGH